MDAAAAETDHASRHWDDFAARESVRDPPQHRVVRGCSGGGGHDAAVGHIEIDGRHPHTPPADLGVGEVGHLQDLKLATGRIARLLSTRRFAARRSQFGSDRSAAVCRSTVARTDEGADTVDVAIGERVLGETERQPDDHLDSQRLTQRVLDLLPRQAGVTVGVEETLLGRDQRALTVDRDRPAFEHHLNGVTRDAEVGEDALGEPVIVGVGEGALTPGVEAEIDSCPGAVRTEDEDRPGVAQPGVVDRQLDDLHIRTAPPTGVVAQSGCGDHEDGLEARDRLSHSRVLRRRRLVLPVPQLGPGWPRHQTALVRGPFRGHSGGTCGSHRGDCCGADRSQFHQIKPFCIT